ncbi:DUF1003 domain-containing protein [Enterobacteriaceae bacterium H20N1]|uniref:DUF1003 domain-containing protein n=1 Tax=Dryocola boscaweniae TaxID=2925397 RepID=A0A9X2WAC3_9ENTR|nr:DUF1003 domain-containing protein [Dryocola boscaweniae]MCT4703824.1 DUF1003 domain-containing protein [Dryocola boscaweniae]MCT4717001.1 DUF1003 domain-containing protein [Dryocola boscaweniae]MCT4720992.1 DUF1003 domain-containing protein [Dryocola boscaweniae]
MDIESRRQLNALRRQSKKEHEELLADPADCEPETTFGQKMADVITGGIATWTFILAQTAIIIVWTAYNLLSRKSGFDPYPFVLLNLFLSFQAAYTAPAIMMSQKRQNINDSRRAEMESNVNVKTDLELYALNEKIDAMKDKDLAELKNTVNELLEELRKMQRPKSSSA